MLPVTFTYNPDGMLWFIASAQTPEVREHNCLIAARDLFTQCLDFINGVTDGVPPSHTPDVIVSLPTGVRT